MYEVYTTIVAAKDTCEEDLSMLIQQHVDAIAEETGGVLRIGCNCCYGEGPDILVWRELLPDGCIKVVFEVDYNFLAPAPG